MGSIAVRESGRLFLGLSPLPANEAASQDLEVRITGKHEKQNSDRAEDDGQTQEGRAIGDEAVGREGRENGMDRLD